MANKYAISIFLHFFASGLGDISSLFNNVQSVFAHKHAHPFRVMGYLVMIAEQKKPPGLPEGCQKSGVSRSP
jgi:hypothetical protein